MTSPIFFIALPRVRAAIDGNPLYVHDKMIPVSDTYRDALFQLVRGGRGAR